MAPNLFSRDAIAVFQFRKIVSLKPAVGRLLLLHILYYPQCDSLMQGILIGFLQL